MNTIKTKISARVILDSINPFNNERVISVAVSAPKFIDAEIMTHGNIVTNSSSSRAIGYPITKLQNHLAFVPPVLQEPSKQMHGDTEVEPYVMNAITDDIEQSLTQILAWTSKYKDHVHKQHLNRYLEPFCMQTKIMTATMDAWENFFNLRMAESADTNIYVLASKIYNKIQNSTPEKRKYHLPLLSREEYVEDSIPLLDKLYASAGRVARYSYGHTSPIDDPFRNAVARCKNILIKFDHKKPLEHCLLADVNFYAQGITHIDVHTKEDYSGRTKNWIQFRKLIWIGLDEFKMYSDYKTVLLREF